MLRSFLVAATGRGGKTGDATQLQTGFLLEIQGGAFPPAAAQLPPSVDLQPWHPSAKIQDCPYSDPG